MTAANAMIAFWMIWFGSLSTSMAGEISSSLVPTLANDDFARTPAMGWSSWNSRGCSVDENDIVSAANVLASRKWKDLGFEYVNVDDCWAAKKRMNGSLSEDDLRFRSGMKRLAQHVHGKGLKFGAYLDRGVRTCAGRPGSLTYEQRDAQFLVDDVGIDYLKEDSCSVPVRGKRIAFRQYATMRDALGVSKNVTASSTSTTVFKSRPVWFSLCGWFPFYAARGHTLGHSWRVSADVTDWKTALAAVLLMDTVRHATGPGGFNDADMLLGSDPVSKFALLPTASRAQFSLWCVLTTPLMLGIDLTRISAFDFETYSNDAIIAVNQDANFVTQGKMTRNECGSALDAYLLTSTPDCVTVHVKEVSGVDDDFRYFAVVITNWSEAYERERIVCDETCLETHGLVVVEIEDLWGKSSTPAVVKTDDRGTGVVVEGLAASSAAAFRVRVGATFGTVSKIA